MEKIILELHEGIVSAIEKMRSVRDPEVEFDIPKGSLIFENSLNIKLLKKEAEVIGKTISLITSDVEGRAMIDMVEESTSEVESDFVSKEIPMSEVVGEKRQIRGGASIFSRLRSIPSVFGSAINAGKSKFMSRSWVPVLIAVVLVVLAIGGIYQYLNKIPKAKISVVVSSQPLIKSVEVKVKSGTDTNYEGRLLSGELVESSVTDSETTNATGEKIVGEKAEGKIKIINRTAEDKDFEEGEELLSTDDDDLVYTLNDDVTVPAEYLEDPSDLINSLSIPGSATIDVTAVNIGEDYNLDEESILEFDDYNRSDYIAEVVEDIDGGSSAVVSIVLQEDLDLLLEKLTTKIEPQGPDAIKGALKEGYELIPGAEYSAVSSGEYDAEVEDEAEEIKLTQTVSYSALSYKEKSLEDMLDFLTEEFVPDGFELSSEERETNVEVLGNTDATVLSVNEADIQVTLKSYVIPEIDEDSVVKELAGKKIGEAERILGGIRNIVTYGIELDSKIPFFRRIPKNVENISLKIRRE